MYPINIWACPESVHDLQCWVLAARALNRGLGFNFLRFLALLVKREHTSKLNIKPYYHSIDVYMLCFYGLLNVGMLAVYKVGWLICNHKSKRFASLNVVSQLYPSPKV